MTKRKGGVDGVEVRVRCSSLCICPWSTLGGHCMGLVICVDSGKLRDIATIVTKILAICTPKFRRYIFGGSWSCR